MKKLNQIQRRWEVTTLLLITKDEENVIKIFYGTPF